jgi:hypothetical protein
MVFYGVTNKESLWMRMSGVPRTLSDGLGNTWRRTQNKEPDSYDEVRDWISQLPVDSWKESIPSGSKLTPSDCKILWQEFSS